MEKLIEPKFIDEPKINPISLVYKEINKDIKNILLIDNLVAQSDILFNSVNSNTLGISYSNYSDREELMKLLTDNFQTIERIGFAFNDSLIDFKQFLNNELFFTSNDLIENQNTYSPNLQFVIDLIKKFNIQNVDYLVCNGLNYNNWVKYFNLLNKETGSIVGASNDETGNLKYGGDWVMETTNENVLNIYWDSEISNYTSRLDTSIISNSITLTNADIGNYTWPITINGGTSSSPVKITFGEDLTLNSVSEYFIIGSEFITIDGGNNTITINNITNYAGLFLNGVATYRDVLSNGFSNITIKNINMRKSNSSLAEVGGLLCCSYFGLNSFSILITNCHSNTDISLNQRSSFICGIGFGRGNGNVGSSNCEITNCSISGIINTSFGGIVGQSTAMNGGLVNISNCYSTGDINGRSSSGICGPNAGESNGIVNITNCYSTGNINGNQSSGICGNQAGLSNGIVNITNCYSTGDMNGEQVSGICGEFAGKLNGTVNITNCYSTGDMNGKQSSGICCQQAGESNGTIYITNCYSTGDINGINSGGIVGTYFGYNSNNLNQITNCYSTGNINGLNSGGICGPQVGYNNIDSFISNVLIENCYTLGIINNSNNTGSICGGYIHFVYANLPIVNIKNCYTLYGPIVSSTLPINIIQTDTYIQPNNIWNDVNASIYLTQTPTYDVSGSLINPIGSVWADISSTTSNVPWLFSTLGYSPYTTNLTTTFTQTVMAGNNSSPALDIESGHVYTIIGINNNLPSVYPSITMNSSTGQLTIDPSTIGGTYLIKILQQSNYTMTNFELIIPKTKNNRYKEFCVRLKENEKFIIRLNEVYTIYSLIEKYRIIKNPKHGCLRLSSKNKLIYTPNKNYTGKDEFVLRCINLISTLSIEITFKIKIKN